MNQKVCDSALPAQFLAIFINAVYLMECLHCSATWISCSFSLLRIFSAFSFYWRWVMSCPDWGCYSLRVGEGRWVESASSLVKIFWELQMVLLQIIPDKFTTFDRKGYRPFLPSFPKTYVQYSKLLTYMKWVGFFKCFVSFCNGLYLLLKSKIFLQGLIWFKLLTVGIWGVLFSLFYLY